MSRPDIHEGIDCDCLVAAPIMAYKVGVIDTKIDLTIIDDARVNSTGMNAILKCMTSLDHKARGIFMHALNDKGHACYVERTSTGEKHYSVIAVRLTAD